MEADAGFGQTLLSSSVNNMSHAEQWPTLFGIVPVIGHGKSLRCEPSFIAAGYLRKLTDTALGGVQPLQGYAKT